MMIDKDILEVILLSGLPKEAVTEQVLYLADHMLKIHPQIATAAFELRQDLRRKGLIK